MSLSAWAHPGVRAAQRLLVLLWFYAQGTAPTPLQDTCELLCLFQGKRSTIIAPCSGALPWEGLACIPILHLHPDPSSSQDGLAQTSLLTQKHFIAVSRARQTSIRTGHLSSAAQPQAGFKGLAVTTRVPSTSPWLCPVPAASTKPWAEQGAKQGSLLTVPGSPDS